MLSEHHYKKLDSACERLTVLAEQTSRLPEHYQKVVSSALNELSVSHLEMQTLLEELGQQNQQLAASRVALEDERRRYQELFEFAPDGYLVTDREGTIFEANSAALKLFKVERDFIIGKQLSDFVVPEESERYNRILKELQESAMQKTCDWRIVLKSGENKIFPASFTAGAVCNVEGEVIGLRWLFSDISWRKKMEEEMLKADKLESIGILAGGIAHDFNNLLASLMGHISLARVYKDSPEKVLQRLDLAERVIVQAKELIHQLFQFSKGDFPDCKVFSVKKAIDNILDLSLDNFSCIKCFCDLPPDLFPVEADETQISQVIHNVIINALQAMPEGGTIQISGENIYMDEAENICFPPLAQRDYLRLSISDTGNGIPLEYLQKIFDPFFTTKKEGTGLGLATSYFIVKKHSGWIEVDSKVGEGTTFHLYLPASSGNNKFRDCRTKTRTIS